MDPSIIKRLSDLSQWGRIAHSLLFIVINYFAQQLIILLGIGQHLFVLFTGKKNKELAQLAESLTRYAYDMMAYYNLQTETKPFPFSAWPKK